MTKDPHVEIHPIPDRSGIIVKVQPPRAPTDIVKSHVPCDIVLVIDVSGSMQTPAPATIINDDGETVQENTGLSVLDITKHAALTVLETLDAGDRLGIVTFSSTGKVGSRLSTCFRAQNSSY